MSMRLMIAVPTTDYMPAGFVVCLTKLMKELSRQNINYDVEVLPGTLVYFARNRLAQKAVNEGYTDVLWLDSDMTFHEKIVDDLLFCGKEMVCGAFVARRPAYSPCVYTSIAKNDIRRVEDFGTTPFQVDGCGFACVLTKTELLKDVMQKFGNCFTPTDDYGEDMAFCWRVKMIGREIWCEPTVRPGHIAHIEVHAGDSFLEKLTEQAGG